MSIPEVDDTLLTIFEKHGRHHHENTEEELPETDFQLSFNVQPDKLGVRIRIEEETRDGSLVVDVAVLYFWDRRIEEGDDLDAFVEETGIPQVLNCASAILVDAAGIIGADVPFYGLEARSTLLENFRLGDNTLLELMDK
jgi:hypothetical protein